MNGSNTAVYRDEHAHSDYLKKALGKVRRLKPVKGELSNERVFEVLYLFYIRAWGIGPIAALCCPDKKDKTILQKITARNSGKEASRRPDVRRIFAEWCRDEEFETVAEKMGLDRKVFKLPSYEENPPGLHQRYKVTKFYGEDDPNALYFVLRLDSGGDDKVWIDCCRSALECLSESLAMEGHLTRLQKEIDQLLMRLCKEDPVGAKQRRKSGAGKGRKGTGRNVGKPAGTLLGGPGGTGAGEAPKEGTHGYNR